MAWRIILLVWFATSVLVEVLSQLVLVMWLRASGVKVSIFLSGVPGYVDGLYADWCETNGRNGRPLLVFRRIWLINCLIVAFAAVGILPNWSQKP